MIIKDKNELKKPCEEIKDYKEAEKIAAELLNYLSTSKKGIGLAANQLGYVQRIFVMDVSNKRDKPQVFINPVIEKRAKEKLTEEEGCLSCPGKFVDVRRSTYVGLKWFCRHGKEQYKTFYRLPARIVQHEMDHLNGKLIIDLS